MRRVDSLWYQTTQATQAAEQTYHRLSDSYDPDFERERERSVSHRRFRTLLDRITRTGTPYGAHTLVYREDGAILLVRHEGVNLWVLPGGEIQASESIRTGARRELAEEAGIEAEYNGIAILTRLKLTSGQYESLGVLPVFRARARTHEPTVDDPDGEISEARWFHTVPEDTRDRGDLVEWRRRTL